MGHYSNECGKVDFDHKFFNQFLFLLSGGKSISKTIISGKLIWLFSNSISGLGIEEIYRKKLSKTNLGDDCSESWHLKENKTEYPFSPRCRKDYINCKAKEPLGNS